MFKTGQKFFKTIIATFFKKSTCFFSYVVHFFDFSQKLLKFRKSDFFHRRAQFKIYYIGLVLQFLCFFSCSKFCALINQNNNRQKEKPSQQIYYLFFIILQFKLSILKSGLILKRIYHNFFFSFFTQQKFHRSFTFILMRVFSLIFRFQIF
jgi:hypothetical protein